MKEPGSYAAVHNSSHNQRRHRGNKFLEKTQSARRINVIKKRYGQVTNTKTYSTKPAKKQIAKIKYQTPIFMCTINRPVCEKTERFSCKQSHPIPCPRSCFAALILPLAGGLFLSRCRNHPCPSWLPWPPSSRPFFSCAPHALQQSRRRAWTCASSCHLPLRHRPQQ